MRFLCDVMMSWDLNVTGYKGRTRDGKTDQAIGLVPKGWVICHPVPGIHQATLTSEEVGLGTSTEAGV